MIQHILLRNRHCETLNIVKIRAPDPIRIRIHSSGENVSGSALNKCKFTILIRWKEAI
jgi:hypothetical protein